MHARDARVSAAEVRLGPDRLEEGDSADDLVLGRREAEEPRRSGLSAGLQPSPAPSRRGQYVIQEPRLQKLTEEDDVEHFLTTFERLALACQWPQPDWAVRLVPLLTGKARDTFVHMDIADSLEYERDKEAILNKYSINPETYRHRFRSLDMEVDETPSDIREQQKADLALAPLYKHAMEREQAGSRVREGKL